MKKNLIRISILLLFISIILIIPNTAIAAQTCKQAAGTGFNWKCCAEGCLSTGNDATDNYPQYGTSDCKAPTDVCCVSRATATCKTSAAQTTAPTAPPPSQQTTQTAATSGCTITPPPTKPASCTSNDCGSKGWCGCSLNTTSEYSCMNSSQGTNCVSGLCPGAANIQCCKQGAAGTTSTGGGNLGPLLPACAATGRCTLCDLIQVAVNFGEFLFAIVGALVLLFFVYGGFRMIISGGKPAEIEKGKSAMVNAVIGILIVFLAYSGVNFIITAVVKQGWSWTGNLHCAPLPAPIQYTAPSESQGAGGPGSTSGGGAPVSGGQTPQTAPPAQPITQTECLNKSGTGTNCNGTSSDCAADCYCANTVCVKKKAIGQYPCTKNEMCLNGCCYLVNEDNWMDPNTPSGCSATEQKNASGTTKIGYCVNPEPKQAAGQFCTNSKKDTSYSVDAQCLPGLFCKSLSPLLTFDSPHNFNYETGNCSEPLAIGEKCGGYYLPHLNATGVSTNGLACAKNAAGQRDCNSLGFCQ